MFVLSFLPVPIPSMPVTDLSHAEVRLDGFTHEQKLAVIREFRRTKNLSEALEVCGVPRRTFYDHVEADPWLGDAYEGEKRRIAWERTPGLVAQAEKGNVTAAIWVQKVFGGDEFNPERPRIGQVFVAHQLAVNFGPTPQPLVSAPPENGAPQPVIDVTDAHTVETR